MGTLPLLELPHNWEPTRATLHSYAKAVAALPRAHAATHPQWWHITLEVTPIGLVTDPLALPDGGTLRARMDLINDAVVLESSDGRFGAISMATGLTGSAFGDELIGLAGSFGLAGHYARTKFESTEPREYDGDDASQYFAALVGVSHHLEARRRALDGSVGPLQVWPHGFDVAFEWFGTKTVPSPEGEGAGEVPAQLNLGFYPAGRAYFYSNPYPFDSSITGHLLPAPAQWNTEGWEGSILYYDELLATESPIEVLGAYAQAVFDAAAPTLMA